MDSPEVRLAGLDDLAFLVEVIHATSAPSDTVGVQDPRTAPWVERVRADIVDGTTYVVLYNGARVGRLRVVRTSERHLLDGIQVLPAYQGRGIGTSIITTLLHDAHGSALALELRVNRRNPSAERLYDRLGFTRVGEDDDEYWMTAAPPPIA